MIPTLIDLENDIIDAITDCEPGRFYTSVEYDDNNGNYLMCDINGWIDDEDGGVSINKCSVSYYDAEDNEISFDQPDEYRIEKEASTIIRDAIREAEAIRETEEWLSWVVGLFENDFYVIN